MLEQNLYIKLIEKGKLFLMTNPLVPSKTECEIEDLFPRAVLEHKIDDKTFSREDNYDTEKHYGKKRFAEYILSNYQKVDFSEFRPLLSALNTVVELQQNSAEV